MTPSLDRAVDFWVCPDCDYYYRVGGVVCDCHGRSTQSRMKHVRMIPTTALPHLSPGVDALTLKVMRIAENMRLTDWLNAGGTSAEQDELARRLALIDNKQESSDAR